MRCLLVLALLAACDDGGSAGMDAYDSARCLIAGHYGDLGAKTGTPMSGMPSSLTVVLDAGPPRDTFFLRLVAGRGAFAGGLQTGTFPIAGADAASATCGLCVNIIADIVTMVGPTKFYFATSGSVTLTSTSPPAGSVSDIAMIEVDSAGTPIPGGCTATIGSMMFSM